MTRIVLIFLISFSVAYSSSDISDSDSIDSWSDSDSIDSWSDSNSIDAWSDNLESNIETFKHQLISSNIRDEIEEISINDLEQPTKYYNFLLNFLLNPAKDIPNQNQELHRRYWSCIQNLRGFLSKIQPSNADFFPMIKKEYLQESETIKTYLELYDQFLKTTDKTQEN